MALRAFLVQQYEMTGQQKELFDFFKSADKNHDGMISRKELIEICMKNGMEFDIQ